MTPSPRAPQDDTFAAEVRQLSARYGIGRIQAADLLCAQLVMEHIAREEQLLPPAQASVLMGMTPSLGHVPNARPPGYDVDVIVRRENSVYGVLGYIQDVFSRRYAANSRISFELLEPPVEEGHGRIGDIVGVPAVFHHVNVLFDQRKVGEVKLDTVPHGWPITVPPCEAMPYFETTFLSGAALTVLAPEDAVGQKIQAVCRMGPQYLDGRQVGVEGADRGKDIGDIVRAAMAMPFDCRHLATATAAAFGVRQLQAASSLTEVLARPGVSEVVRASYEAHSIPGVPFDRALRIATHFADPVLRSVAFGGPTPAGLWEPGAGWTSAGTIANYSAQSLPPRPTVDGFLHVDAGRRPQVHNLPVLHASRAGEPVGAVR